MEPLHHIPAPSVVASVEPAGRQFGAWLRQRDLLVRFLASVTLLSLLLCVGLCVALVYEARQRVQGVWIDAGRNSGTFTITPFEEATEIHTDTAKFATEALLARGPKELDLPELLSRLYSRQTQALAEQLRQQEQPDFVQRQLHQKPEITSVEAVATHATSVEVKVRGQLHRAGQLGGQPLNDDFPFTLRLSLVFNPDRLRAARYPLMVSSFTLVYESTHP